MLLKMLLCLGIVIQLFILGSVEGACSTNQIKCRTRNKCISLSDVCRNGKQCPDGSDEDPEICKFWVYDCTSETAKFTCRRFVHECKDVQGLCKDPSCNDKSGKICKLVKKGKLQLKEGPNETLSLNDEVVQLLQESVNSVSSLANTSCPMLYIRVGGACISLFSLAKVPWSEARQFCLSIGGDLLGSVFVRYDVLMQYMRAAELTTDYWIGGHFTLKTNAWSWVVDDNPMPLGSPLWATRYSSTCVPRPLPQIDATSDPPNALLGAPCFNYVQAPATRTVGKCAAMTYEYFYYFTDEDCQEARSPMCVYLDEETAALGYSTA